MLETNEITEPLPCKLTHDEINDRALKMTGHLSKIDELEGHKSSFNSQIKADIEREETEVRRLKNIVISGTESRDVKCLWKFNWNSDIKEFIRTDTGEVYRRIPIIDEERQGRLEIKTESTPGTFNESAQIDNVNVSEEVKKCSCGTVFIIRVAGQEYCSKKCKDAARNEKKRANRKKDK